MAGQEEKKLCIVSFAFPIWFNCYCLARTSLPNCQMDLFTYLQIVITTVVFVSLQVKSSEILVS